MKVYRESMPPKMKTKYYTRKEEEDAIANFIDKLDEDDIFIGSDSDTDFEFEDIVY